MSFIDSASEVIANSLLNKYNDWPIKNILEYTCFIITSREDNICSKTEKDNNELCQDIKNQFNILSKIDSKWVHRKLSEELLREINSELRGIDSSKLEYRSFEYVKDFGGKALTDSSEITIKLKDLKKKFELAEKFSALKKTERALLMAIIFCEVIKIHPFDDGNGRTARLLVQILARKWGYDLIIIPKYRNDIKWRNALNEGLNGDFSLMSDFFYSRLNKIN